MKVKLIADSGATKTEWALAKNGEVHSCFTQGISPYFFTEAQISELLRVELIPQLPSTDIHEIHYYGTGCANPNNAKLVERAIAAVFGHSEIEVQTDLMAAARAMCQHSPGIASIMGTGSNSCYYDGRMIIKNSPGLGYVLGDEASGAYLGKKVIQYFLYEIFDEALKEKFITRFNTTNAEILDHVYRKPLPNRYLAGFAIFLAENRGHFMIENIIEDGLNDFFYQHLNRYAEAHSVPFSFVGSVAWGFKDVIADLCERYEFELGNIEKNPMRGLVNFHSDLSGS